MNANVFFDTCKNMVIVKNEIRTPEITYYHHNKKKNKVEIRYRTEKIYEYSSNTVELLKKPRILNGELYRICAAGQMLFNVEAIYIFKGKSDYYLHICFMDDTSVDYKRSDVTIERSLATFDRYIKVFDYMKDIAGLIDIGDDDYEGADIFQASGEIMEGAAGENGEGSSASVYAGDALNDEESGQDSETKDSATEVTDANDLGNSEKKEKDFFDDLMSEHDGASDIFGAYNSENDILLENNLIDNAQNMARKKEWKLLNNFAKINSICDGGVLTKYLDPSSDTAEKLVDDNILIFPFAFNKSQYEAVKNAMENRISIIDGLPGTGKTSTILNIIANILLRGKTVQVVSGNAASAKRIYDILCDGRYNLEFAVRMADEMDAESYIESGRKKPDMSSLGLSEDASKIREDIVKLTEQVNDAFEKKVRLAGLMQELSRIDTEMKHFMIHAEKTGLDMKNIKGKKNISSDKWMELWHECDEMFVKKNKLDFKFKNKLMLKFGLKSGGSDNKDMIKLITSIQYMYYNEKKAEITSEIGNIKKTSDDSAEQMMSDLKKRSLAVLWDAISEKNSVVISDAYSKSAHLKNKAFDYVIIDDASQVDVAAGTLALSPARNTVIVGDSRQRPYIINGIDKEKAEAVYKKYNVGKGYYYTKTILQSIKELIPDVTVTMLKEHYRCDPQVINFCNSKFYRGELIVMTEGSGDKDAMSIVGTIPKISRPRFTAIVAAGKEKAEELAKQYTDVDVLTPLEIQSREKDVIILAAEDDEEASQFKDDPYLLSSVISRARRKLVVVVKEEEPEDDYDYDYAVEEEVVKKGNITDLVNYINYQNIEIGTSRAYYVFDYLYRRYLGEKADMRADGMQDNASESDISSVIYDILADDKYSMVDCIRDYPLHELIGKWDILTEREYQYAVNPEITIDFLLFNRISKKPVLAVEDAGYEYNKNGTVEYSRDLMKDNLLGRCAIPLVTYDPQGDDDRKKIISELDGVLF